jgi:hypothetical protein
MKIYVPRDAAAKALGAEDVVRALMAEAEARALTVEIVRTGTRGMIWLEPLVEVERDGVRHGYGPFAPSDAVALLRRDAGWARPGGGDPFLRASGPADLRAGGADRSARTFPITRPMAVCPVCAGRWAWMPPPSSRR